MGPKWKVLSKFKPLGDRLNEKVFFYLHEGKPFISTGIQIPGIVIVYRINCFIIYIGKPWS